MSEIKIGTLEWKCETERYRLRLVRRLMDEGDTFLVETTDKAALSGAAILGGAFLQHCMKDLSFSGPDARLAALELGRALVKMATMPRPD